MFIGNLDGVRDLRGKLVGREDYSLRSLSKINYLVVHHTGVDVDNTAESIAEYHSRVLGWPGIGYHFLVHMDGRAEYVGDVTQVRYNVAGRNQEVVGICLTGDFSRKTPVPVPVPVQLKAARLLLANLQFALGWFVPILGHREIALPGHETACPGDTWLQWKEELSK